MPLIVNPEIMSPPPGTCWYGVDALNDSSYYAIAGGIAGSATGFHVQAWVRVDSQDVTSLAIRTIAGTGDNSTRGWCLYTAATNSTINFVVYNGAGSPILTTPYTVQASDVGKPLHLVGMHDGTKIWLYVNGSATDSGTTCTGYTAPGTGTYIGRSNVIGKALYGAVSVFGVSGGSFVPSSGEITTAYTTGKQKAQIQSIPSKTSVLWDVALDRTSQAPCGLYDTPAAATTAATMFVGADPSNAKLTLFGQWVGFRDNSTNGIFTTSGAPTGLLGSASTGLSFCIPIKIESQAVSSAGRTILEHCVTANTSGYELYTTGTNSTLVFKAGDGTSAISAPTYAIQASDVGRVMVVHCVVDLSAGKARLYVDGVEQGTGTTISAYATASRPTALGIRSVSGSQPATSISIFGLAGGDQAWSASEVAANVTAVQAASDVVAVPGKTTHIWSVRRSRGLFGPGALLDRSGSTNIPVGSANNSLPTIATRQADKINHGLQSLSTSDYYASASLGGVAGSASGFWVAALFRIDNQGVASQVRYLFARTGYPGTVAGYRLFASGSNTVLGCQMANNAAAMVSAPTYSVPGSAIGKVFHLVAVHDGSFLRLYVSGCEQGAGTSIAGYSVYSGPQTIGGTFANADGLTIFGAMGGLGVPSISEIRQNWLDCMSANDVVAIAGKTDHLYSLRSSLSVPSTINDLVGGDALSKVGSPTLATDYGLSFVA